MVWDALEAARKSIRDFVNEIVCARPRHETTLSGRRVTSPHSRSHRADNSSDYGNGGEGVRRGGPDARCRPGGRSRGEHRMA